MMSFYLFQMKMHLFSAEMLDFDDEEGSCFEEGLDTVAEELKEMNLGTSDEPRITFMGTLLSPYELW